MATPRVPQAQLTTDEDINIEIADVIAFTEQTEAFCRAALRWSRIEAAKEQS